MWLEDTPKPASMKLWFEKHQNSYLELSEFEDDDIEDFAGHDLLEDDEEEVDNDDMSWLHPPKGPGEFKNLKKKKKGRKSKKGRKGRKTKKSKGK